MAVQLPVAFEFRASKTFESFYPGPHQELLDHLRALAQGRGERQWYLWGAPGVGKSHLLQACGHLAHQLRQRVFYFSFAGLLNPSSVMTAELLSALEDYELVCLDDIDDLIGQEDWERAFFSFYNAHRERGHRLLLAASKPPGALSCVLPDNRTRLAWGVTWHVQELPEEDKLEALRFKARQLGFLMPLHVARFLLHRSPRDLPSLWALLDRLDHASLAAQRRLTVPFVKRLLEKAD